MKFFNSIFIKLLIFILFVFIYYFYVFTPSKEVVISKAEQVFISKITLKSILIDNILSRQVQGAKSLSSRTMIRKKIIDYKKGLIDFAELESYTKNKYIDGVNALEDVISANRIIDNKVLIDYDENVSEHEKIFFDDKNKEFSVKIFKEQNYLITNIVSPIFDADNYLGYDELIYKTDLEKNDIINPQINFEIYPNDETKHILINKIFHDYGKAYYLYKSDETDSIFDYSISHSVIYEEVNKFKNNQIIIFSLSAVALLLIIFITDRINKIKTIKESFKRFQTFFDLAPDAIVLAKYDTGKIIRVNKAAEELFETNGKSIIGKHQSELHPKGYQDVYINKFKGLLPDVVNILDDGIEILTFTGKIKSVEIRTIIITINNDKFVLGNIQDVTERKKQELIISQNQKEIEKYNQELKEANIAKDKFISILAHDLKSPFSGLIGLASLIEEEFDEMNRKELKEIFSLMQNNVIKTYNLLSNLLEWARSQLNKIHYIPEMQNLFNLVTDELDLLYQNAEIKSIKLIMDIPEKIQVFADAYMLRTIIRNLVNNSIKYTKKNGTISVIAHKLENSTVIKVSDDGIGMSKVIKESLFKVGSTISKAGTNGESGTGFGLLLCKEFVEYHNGTIEVESEEGKGTTFIVTIPEK